MKKKVTVLLSQDVADALHAASLAAGGYGNKSAIVERALRKELGLMHTRIDAETFAQALGFDDYEALCQASESIVSEGDVDWFVTRLPDGRWAAWDDSELALDRVSYFSTREEAVQYHQDAARSSGIE